MASTSRLLQLLSLLQARRDWPGDVLADRLEVSGRTVRRDVERLREMGYVIQSTKGPDGGYRLEAGAELPPLLFDDEQVLSIAIALRTAATSGAEVGEGALRALATIRQVMPSALRHRLDALRFTTLPSRGGRGAQAPVDPDVLLGLATAVRAREVLRFDYLSGGDAPDAEPHPRRVEPHHVVAAHDRWYLVAWDLDRGDWRLFRADRIRPRTPTGPRFARRPLPGGDVRAFVAARFRGVDPASSGAGGPAGEAPWACRGTAIVHLPAARIRPFLAADAELEELDATRTRITDGAWSWTALANTFGRFDAPFELEGPAELREAGRDLVRRYATAADVGSGA